MDRAPLNTAALLYAAGMLLAGTTAGYAQIPKMQGSTIPFYSVGTLNLGDDLKPFFIVDKAHVWPTHKIEVCWEPGAESYNDERQAVQAAVTTHIEQNSDFRFINWLACDTDQKARIRILVNDTPSESEVGYRHFHTLLSGDGTFPTHMEMNFTFRQWNKNCGLNDNYRMRCITTIAVHEFLHALGALHEQISKDLQTKDSNCWALYKAFPDIHGESPVPLTVYDPDSIMNYCRPIYSEPTRLSNLDLIGLKKLSQMVGG
jgi:hypothetical protein